MPVPLFLQPRKARLLQDADIILSVLHRLVPSSCFSTCRFPLGSPSRTSTPTSHVRCRPPRSHRFLLNGFKSFSPLSKVLFVFPSQYLFAIGLPYIFSFRRSLSPILGCTPEQPDSSNTNIRLSFHPLRDFHPL